VRPAKSANEERGEEDKVEVLSVLVKRVFLVRATGTNASPTAKRMVATTIAEPNVNLMMCFSSFVNKKK
jgi:hypothetical protein